MNRLHIPIGIMAVALALGGWLWYERAPRVTLFADPAIPLVASATSAPATRAAHREAPPGATEWYDETYRFSLFYPSSLAVKTYDEGSGATTYAFQNVEHAQGFQIFVVPYGATQVTEEQFRRDAPSGVRENLRAATIGGASGAVFYSMNPTLGETYEAWFIKDGYLYEVTAPKSLESWLNDILSTWLFI